MARPRIEVDYKQAGKLAEIQCTIDEIAHVLGVSSTKLKRDDEFRAIYDQAREKGKTSLRRLQWAAARRGSTAMLIWLGKQYLGQTDRVESAVTVSRNVRSLTDDELAEIIAGGRSGGTTEPTQGAAEPA
jgi:hypothetical protein